jgi:hypothetical protein
VPPTCYGPRLASVVALWSGTYRMSKRRVASFCREVLGVEVAVGEICRIEQTVTQAVTPGQNQKHYLAGALEPRTGRLVYCTSERKTNALFRALLDRLDWLYPKAQFSKVYLVVDNYGIHKAKAIERWLAVHPRFELLFLPTYCPRLIRLSGLLGMSMTSVRAIITAPASRIWSGTWNNISWPMARGTTTSRTCTTARK